MTISTLRPSATVFNDAGVWGSSAHAALADDSPATFVEYTGSKSSRFSLDNLTLFAGAVIKQIRIRIRVAAGDGSSPPGVLLVVTDHLDPGVNAEPITVTWTAPATITCAEVQGGPWSDAEVDAVELTISRELAGPELNVYEAYIDVVQVTVPQVHVDYPTGTPITDDDTPNVEWIPTLDEDGGAQTHFRAVYMGNGDDPDVDLPEVDSGIVESAETIWTPTTELANGLYDVYVKIAQTVNGELHWSTWDDVQGVTIDVDRPISPGITVAGEDEAARVRIDIVDPGGGDVSTDFFQIQSSIDGAPFIDIRTEDGGGLIAPEASEAVAWDLEGPNGQSVMYRARAIHNYGTGASSRSAWVTDTGSWSSTKIWIKDPVRPSLNAHNQTYGIFRSFQSQSRDSAATVHKVLGRADPIVTRDAGGRILESGTLTIMTEDAAERALVDALLDSGDVLLLQFPAVADEPDRYIATIGSHNRSRIIDRQGQHLRDEEINWQEVIRPEGNLDEWPAPIIPDS